MGLNPENLIRIPPVKKHRVYLVADQKPSTLAAYMAECAKLSESTLVSVKTRDQALQDYMKAPTEDELVAKVTPSAPKPAEKKPEEPVPTPVASSADSTGTQ